MPPARTTAAACAAFTLTLALLTSPAQASVTEDPLSRTTSVGVHNAYEKGTFPYFADALDSGAGLLELDVWTDEWFGVWRVDHELLGQSNNCAGATAPEELGEATATSPTACATCASGTRPTSDTGRCCSRSN
ncbi:hypothetical protein [Nocardiopsis sp. ATB16-24]|uniref:hypothetical protein n=1 Tax=Nocardiopsis sp. ATB16-24 TaxID=3019555 RepID=UPI0025542371|nr:hypothetical protein [Nocardiopsis sp. ATB16-24]